MGEQNGIPNASWTKLLCLAQSANADGNRSEPAQMSEQDRKFIEKAMGEAMRISDPVRIMSENIAMLKLIKEPNDENLKIVTKIVDDLEDIVCDIDCAVDFCKLGGLPEIIRLLKSQCDSVRTEVARLIPSLAQSNPSVQDVMLKSDLLRYLLTVIKDVNASEELRIKVLSSISSIVRAHEKAFSQFCQLKGLETIVEAFQKAIDMHHANLANKAILIMTSMAHSLGPDAKNYNVLSLLLRMSLQLPADCTGCSYAFEYLMDNIVCKGEEEDVNNDLTDDGDDNECKKRFKELDIQCKRQFRELLQRQLKHEQQLSNRGLPERIQRKIKMIEDVEI